MTRKAMKRLKKYVINIFREIFKILHPGNKKRIYKKEQSDNNKELLKIKYLSQKKSIGELEDNIKKDKVEQNGKDMDNIMDIQILKNKFRRPGFQPLRVSKVKKEDGIKAIIERNLK